MAAIQVSGLPNTEVKSNSLREKITFTSTVPYTNLEISCEYKYITFETDVSPVSFDNCVFHSIYRFYVVPMSRKSIVFNNCHLRFPPLRDSEDELNSIEALSRFAQCKCTNLSYDSGEYDILDRPIQNLVGRVLQSIPSPLVNYVPPFEWLEEDDVLDDVFRAVSQEEKDSILRFMAEVLFEHVNRIKNDAMRTAAEEHSEKARLRLNELQFPVSQEHMDYALTAYVGDNL